MYYRSVNRGIHMTVPGRYTIALVLALGLIAIASGYNGIYLSLSLGIAILIISGLLSERIMKHFEITGSARANGDAGRPFTLEVMVRNRDDKQVLYGIECLVFETPPDFPFFRKDPVPRMRAYSFMLEPGESGTVSGTCEGLKRGHYEKLHAVQRTLYPFGLLTKFKVSVLETDISILPPVDDELFRRLSTQLRHQMARTDAEREFYCHRSRNPLDPTRLIDWRRSAGRPASEWVVKVFESRTREQRIRICVSPGFLPSAKDEATYERRLGEIRTAAEVAHASTRPFELEMEGVRVASDLPEVYRLLAAAPHFDLRGVADVVTGVSSPWRNGELRLSVAPGGVIWGEGGAP